MFSLTKHDQQILNHSGIDGLILFGSQAQNSANQSSDYDILVIGHYSPAAYDTIYNLLADKINQITDIDIVFSPDAPMELKNHVVKYGQVLFQKNPAVFPDFKQQVMLESADFAPYRTIFSDATLARINL